MRTNRVPYCYTLLSPPLALSDQVICQHDGYLYVYATILSLSSPLVTAWNRQKAPIVAACGITPPGNSAEAAKGVNCRGLRYHPPLWHGCVCYVYHILPILLIPPPADNILHEKTPPMIANKTRIHHLHCHRGTLDTTQPQEITPGEKNQREILITRGGFLC